MLIILIQGAFLSINSSAQVYKVLHGFTTHVPMRLYEVPNFDTKKKALSSRKRLKKA